MQITRILCTGLCLGAADTALRLAVDFALTRRRYGEAIFSIPHARATLCNAFLDLMICDCVAISAARALHACPGQASVWSAVAKYFVPVTVESAIRDLAVVLGGSSFLRTGHPWSMFQKMARDSSIVSVFEGSTVVQLYALGLQLEQLARRAPDRRTHLNQPAGNNVLVESAVCLPLSRRTWICSAAMAMMRLPPYLYYVSGSDCPALARRVVRSVGVFGAGAACGGHQAIPWHACARAWKASARQTVYSRSCGRVLHELLDS